jgi:hypothetical protein
MIIETRFIDHPAISENAAIFVRIPGGTDSQQAIYLLREHFRSIVRLLFDGDFRVDITKRNTQVDSLGDLLTKEDSK